MSDDSNYMLGKWLRPVAGRATVRGVEVDILECSHIFQIGKSYTRRDNDAHFCYQCWREENPDVPADETNVRTFKNVNDLLADIHKWRSWREAMNFASGAPTLREPQ